MKHCAVLVCRGNFTGAAQRALIGGRMLHVVVTAAGLHPGRAPERGVREIRAAALLDRQAARDAQGRRRGRQPQRSADAHRAGDLRLLRRHAAAGGDGQHSAVRHRERPLREREAHAPGDRHVLAHEEAARAGIADLRHAVGQILQQLVHRRHDAGRPGGGRLIGCCGDRELFVGEDGAGLVVVLVADRLGFDGKGIAVLHAATAAACEEEPVRVTHGAGVTVGHVHQIDPAVLHAHEVPHMGPGARAAAHGSGHAIDRHRAAERRPVAEVLEGLGIALAYHIGKGVFIKDRDDLPGVAVGAAVVERGIVVADRVADTGPVALQLLQIAAALELRNDGRRVGNGLADPLALAAVHAAEIAGKAPVRVGDIHIGLVGIARDDGKGKDHGAGDPDPVRVAGKAVGLERGAHGLVIPVHLIGAGALQAVDHAAQLEAQLRVHRGHGLGGIGLFAVRVFGDQSLQPQLLRRPGVFLQVQLLYADREHGRADRPGGHGGDLILQDAVYGAVDARQAGRRIADRAQAHPVCGAPVGIQLLPGIGVEQHIVPLGLAGNVDLHRLFDRERKLLLRVVVLPALFPALPGLLELAVRLFLRLLLLGPLRRFPGVGRLPAGLLLLRRIVRGVSRRFGRARPLRLAGLFGRARLLR